MKQKELLQKLRKEIKILDKQINHRFSTNIQNFIMQIIIKMGIAVDECLPYILSFFIIMYANHYIGKKPFAFDLETVKAKVQTMDTSNGYHFEKISFDYSYNDREFCHSTGWVINENGLYERIITTYRIDDSIDLMDLDSIFKMSKEEIENLLVITNIEVIQKNELSDEDKIYDEEVLIVVNSYEDDDNTMQRLESMGDYLTNLLAYFVISFGTGFLFSKIKKIVLKNCVRNKLNKFSIRYKIINYNEEELNKLREILNLKEENLSLLENSNNSNDNNNTYRLRRRG